MIAFPLTQNPMSTSLVLFYPLSASITLLCNILDNPALPSAVQDYELLKTVPKFMNGMSMHGLNAEELLHRDYLESLVNDLIRAAQCAISTVGGNTP
jgi:hypothetical protein